MHFVAIGLGSRAELRCWPVQTGTKGGIYVPHISEGATGVRGYNARVPLCTTTRYFEICHSLALHLSTFRNVWQRSEDRLPTQDRTLFSCIELPSRYVPNYFFVQRPHIAVFSIN